MPGPQTRVYPITQEEAASIEKDERLIRRAGYAATALGTVACATGGIMHYFGGQDLAKTANEVVESGLYALGLGALVIVGLLQDRMIHSPPKHPSMTGALEKRIDPLGFEEVILEYRINDKI